MKRAVQILQRSLMPNSLRFQLLSRSLLVLAALLLLVGVFQYVIMSSFIYKNKAVSMHSQMMAVSRDVLQQIGGEPFPPFSSLPETSSKPSSLPPSFRDGDRAPILFMPDSSLVFVDLSGKYTVLSQSPDQNGDPPKLAEQEYEAASTLKMKQADRQYKIVQDEADVKQLVVLQPLEMHGRIVGVLQMSTRLQPLKDVLMRQLLTFLLLALLALVVGALAFIPVLRRTLVPLSNMASTVEGMTAGNLSHRVPESQGQLEIDSLAEAFNGMLKRLELSFEMEREAKEQMRRFIADASHELRTPLTSIHGFLEVLLRGAMHQPEQLSKALNSMYGESGRINKLVEDLLLLAKMDRMPLIHMKEDDLGRIVKEMEPQLRLLADHRSISLELDPRSRCRFDADKMKQVVLNLVHNAVQHTDAKKGRIEIIVNRLPDGVSLTVRDNGSGIAQEHLLHIFDRFYRSDSSRTRKYGGAGLGLPISQSIVEAHGGKLWAESIESQGSSFHVLLPDHTTVNEDRYMEA